jgi:hypothetical protein
MHCSAKLSTLLAIAAGVLAVPAAAQATTVSYDGNVVTAIGCSSTAAR